MGPVNNIIKIYPEMKNQETFIPQSARQKCMSYSSNKRLVIQQTSLCASNWGQKAEQDTLLAFRELCAVVASFLFFVGN